MAVADDAHGESFWVWVIPMPKAQGGGGILILDTLRPQFLKLIMKCSFCVQYPGAFSFTTDRNCLREPLLRTLPASIHPLVILSCSLVVYLLNLHGYALMIPSSSFWYLADRGLVFY
ncbi:hypothetical protein ACFL5J_02435 [Thermodesulfobacteriota bacterium]